MRTSRSFDYTDNFYFKKQIPLKRNRIFSSFFFVWILSFLVFSLLYLLLFNTFSTGRENDIDAEIADRLNLAEFFFLQDLPGIGEDLLLIQDEFVRDSLAFQENGFNQLEERMYFFARSRSMYKQVRFLDASGMERIRINHALGRFEMVAKDQLQDKSERYYFTDARELGPGEIYVSPLDLNIENGEVVIPFEPTLRFAIPVFDSNTIFQGVFVLNYNANRIFSSFDENFPSNEFQQYAIIDQNARFLRSFSGKEDWLFPEAFRSNYKELYLNLDKGFYRDGHRAYIMKNFFPFKEMESLLDERAVDISAKSQSLSAKDRWFAVIVQRRLTTLWDLDAWTGFLAFFVLFSILLFILIYFQESRIVFSLWMEGFFQGIENNPAALILTDAEGKILYVNKKFQHLSGYKNEEIFKEHSRILKSGQMNDDQYKEMWEIISTGATWTGEFHNRDKNGRLYWVNASISPITDKKGRIIRYLAVQEDISRMKELMDRLETNALTDPLTGLENRRGFYERSIKEVARAMRGNHSFALLMLDIDLFKQVNDSYGHQAGDTVLVDLAKTIQENLRESDFCARFGGEEFVIVLTDASIEDGEVFAERLRLTIADHPVLSMNNTLKYTVSIGIVEWRQGETINMTLARADGSLYEAKKQGRNRSVAES
jgi:diguanylate cyclase (GGDEF)-like protein/PAS domain S-box-containing protein